MRNNFKYTITQEINHYGYRFYMGRHYIYISDTIMYIAEMSPLRTKKFVEFMGITGIFHKMLGELIFNLNGFHVSVGTTESIRMHNNEIICSIELLNTYYKRNLVK